MFFGYSMFELMISVTLLNCILLKRDVKKWRVV